MRLDKQEITNLGAMFESSFWAKFEEFLKREEEVCINSVLKSTDERQLGRLAFIRELLNLKKNAREAARQ